VHRDIKPANILLENGVERVKITDFGLARAVDDASVTQSGTVAGTPMYMSPEQAEGLSIDHRSDLFSLGSVLYTMCTGHSPFRASGTHAVLKRVIDASPRPIREINNEIPDWLCDIVAKLQAKKPEDRLQTATELAELLGQRLADVQAGRSVAGEPSRVSDRVGAPETAPTTRPLTRPGSPTPGLVLFIVGLAFLVMFLSSKMEGNWGVNFNLRMGQPDPWLIWEVGPTSSRAHVQFISWGMLFGVLAAGCLTWAARLRAAGRATTQGAPGRRRRGWLWANAAVLLIGVGNGLFFLTFFGRQEPRVMVDSNDPDVEVAITRVEDGRRHPLLPLHENTMPAGKYRVYVHAGEGQLIESISIPEWAQKRSFPGEGIKEDSWQIELERGQQVTLVIKTSPSSATVNLGKPFFFDHVNLDKVVIKSIEMVDARIHKHKEGPQVAALKHEPPFLKQRKTTNQAKLLPGWYKMEFVCQTGYNVSKLELVNERTGQKSWAALQPGHGANYWRLLELKPGDEITIQVAVDKEPGWVQLFNGKDLDGWAQLKKHWAWENGTLVYRLPPEGIPVTFNSGNVLLWSTQSYRDFEMRFQARMKDKGLCMVQFRGEFNNDGEGNVWLRGPHLNIGLPDGGSLCQRWTRTGWQPAMLQQANPVAVKKIVKENDFDNYSIRCQGKHVTLKINGLTTVDGDYDKIPAMGNLCFYISAGHSPLEIVFRNIEITKLPSK
jgi:hypothetical protein